MAAQPDDMTSPRTVGPRPDDDRIVLDDPAAEPAVTEEPVAVQEPVAEPRPAADQDPLADQDSAADDEDPLADDEDPLADDEPVVVVVEPAAESAAAEPLVTEPSGAGPGGPSANGAALAGDRPDTTPAAALAEQQWPAIQAMFVDDPRGAVERAAAAAGEVAASLIATLEREQAELRASWQRDTDTDTEGLRTALQRYRAFCGRLEGLA